MEGDAEKGERFVVGVWKYKSEGVWKMRECRMWFVVVLGYESEWRK